MLTKSQKTYIDKIRRRIGKTIIKHQLIQDGDRILIGVSGGKDSMILLDALSSKRSGIPYKFEIIAVHVNVENVPYQADIDFIKNLCDERNVPFHIINISLDFDRDPKLSKCFVCSWHRRAELFKLTNKFNCNKLALGHHMDDAVETLLLNMSFNAEISSLPFRVSMFKGKFEIIRPLLSLEEKDLIRYSRLLQLNREISKCPWADDSRRKLMKNIIKQLEKINPDVRKNIFRSTNKIIDQYLPKLENYELHRRNSRKT